MRVKAFASLLVLSWMLAAVLVYMHKDRVQLVKLPPGSLAQWYKPQNERHVWLHNMFKLRREVQAIRFYAAREQAEPLKMWTDRLFEHYLKIRDMVPEWAGRLDQNAILNLRAAQQTNRYDEIPVALEELQQSCDSCHGQFRAVTAALYRGPDFSEMQITASASLAESMQALNAEVNNIKIAIGAGDQTWAMSSLNKLDTGMREMDTLCQNCHTHSARPYPDSAAEDALDELQTALLSGTKKQQGRALGTLAVSACAQCHGTHRIAYDTLQLFRARTGLIELFRH